MRYLLLVALLAALLPVGCQDQPPHQVEMSTPPELPPIEQPPPLPQTAPAETQPADQPAPADQADHPDKTPTLTEATEGRTYLVQKGDTYWKIAQKMLGNAQRWKEIEALNADVDRRNLKIGQSIRIPLK